MNDRAASRTQMAVYLAVAFGLPYLMGIPLYIGYASGADVNVFPIAQMMYPAAGVMLGLLATRCTDPDLPRGFFGFYLAVTAALLASSLASVALPQLPWLLISNFIVMGASVAAWVALALTKRPKRAAYGLGWPKGSTGGAVACTLAFAGLYVLRIFLPAFLTGTQGDYLAYLATPAPYLMLVTVILNFFLSFLMFFGEEYGWRYFLQPRMQVRFGSRLGVVLLGVVWGLWHLPLNLFYYAPDTPLQSIAAQVGCCICYGVVIAWGYLKTGNLWVPVLMHFINNNLGLVFIPDLTFQNNTYTWPDVLFSLVFLGVLHLPFLASRVFARRGPTDGLRPCGEAVPGTDAEK